MCLYRLMSRVTVIKFKRLILDPSHSGNFPQDYLEKVKKVHSEGGYGSLGYHYDWKIEEAEKNVLRTHTTAVSARMLYKLMEQVIKNAYSCVFQRF